MYLNSFEELSMIEILSIESPNTKFGVKASTNPRPSPLRNPKTFALNG